MQQLPEEERTDQVTINDTQDSASVQTLNTTQYMSHGVSWAGSDELRALYEANIGKRTDATELQSRESILLDLLEAIRSAANPTRGKRMRDSP